MTSERLPPLPTPPLASSRYKILAARPYHPITTTSGATTGTTTYNSSVAYSDDRPQPRTERIYYHQEKENYYNNTKTNNNDDNYDQYEEQPVDASLLQRGDVVRVLQGESVSADGILLTSTPLSVDESLLTGKWISSGM